jgi:hypothetical protein
VGCTLCKQKVQNPTNDWQSNAPLSAPWLHAPVGPVVDLAGDGLVHGDGVVQPGARVPRQVLAVAVAAEDERLGHKQAVALGRERHDLRTNAFCLLVMTIDLATMQTAWHATRQVSQQCCY